MGDFVDLVRLLASYDIELRDTNSTSEANDSYELLQGIQALLAQHENRLKSRRVMENMKRHASEGYRMHKAPFGLRNARDAMDHSVVEPVQPEADKIAHILSKFSSGGFTKSELLQEARKIGLTQQNGRSLSYQYLNKMLRQPLYAGFEKNTLTEGQLIPSKFDGLVSRYVYEMNQRILEMRRLDKFET